MDDFPAFLARAPKLEAHGRRERETANLGWKRRILESRPSRLHHVSMWTIPRLHEVARQLRERLGQNRGLFWKVVNAMVRRGLWREVPQLPRFEVKAKACGFQAGVDLLRLNQLNDELEVEDFQRELAAARRQQ